MGDLHRLALPTPFPVGPVNAYLLEGDPLTLVDPGPAYGPAWRALRSSLDRLGHRLEDVRRLLITHPHLDHFGAAASVVAISGAEVLAHHLALPWLTSLDGEWVRRAGFLRAEFARLGAPGPAIQGLEASMRRLGRYARPVSEARGLEDGDELELGGKVWRVLHTPGHSSGCVCLYDPLTRRLLSGDYLLQGISSNALLEPPQETGRPRERSLLTYLASLRRGGEWDVERVFPGHGRAFGDHRGVIDRRFRHYDRRQARLARLLAAAGDRGLTAHAICRLLFPSLGPDGLFLGLSEVVGHLDLLAAGGRLEERPDGEVSRFVLSAREEE